jgi:hypothetical protein
LPGQEDSEAEEGGEGDELDGQARSDDDEEQRALRVKFAPRKLQSNAWRYTEPEKDDAQQAEEQESEDEIDLTGLIERVAKLDSNRTSKTLVSSEAAALRGIEEDFDDIDVSLLHLLAKNRLAKEGAHGRNGHEGSGYTLSDEQVRELEEEGRRLLEEKARQEKHERRARILKQSAKSISVNIGSGTSDRKVEERIPDSKGYRRAKSNDVAHIYSDDDEDGAPADLDDTEAFLQERLGGRRQTEPSTQAKPRDLVKQTNDSRAADEDFLDTIL